MNYLVPDFQCPFFFLHRFTSFFLNSASGFFGFGFAVPEPDPGALGMPDKHSTAEFYLYPRVEYPKVTLQAAWSCGAQTFMLY